MRYVSLGRNCLVLTLFAAAPVAAAGPDNPTFAKHVAPIFQEKCEACHRPDSIAPMPLRTFEEARPWARSIKVRVEARQMPPWHIDKTIGVKAFKDDRSLSDEQLETIVRWVDQGAPQGAHKYMPAPKLWPAAQTSTSAESIGKK